MNTQPEIYQLPLEEEPESTVAVLRGGVRFLQLLNRRRHIVITFAVAALALGVVYYLVAPLQFESIAKLQINQQVPDEAAAVGDSFNTETVMASQRDLVRSAKIVQSAIEKLAPAHRLDFADKQPRDWVQEVTNRLDASTVRKTKHMEVRYRSAHPEAAAAVVAAVIDAYIHFVEKNHRSEAEKMLDKLAAERERLDKDLADKQSRLQAFRREKGHLTTQTQSSVVEPAISRAIALSESVVEAQKERVALQASYSTVENAVRSGGDLRRHLASVEKTVGQKMLLRAIGMGEQDVQLLLGQQERLIESEAELRRISPYLGDSHPQVRALNEQILATRQYLASYQNNAGQQYNSLSNDELGPLLVNLLRESIQQAWGREQELRKSFEVAQADAVRQSGNLAQLQMLERDVERIERQHDLVYQKIKSVDFDRVQAPIRVVAIEDPLPDDVAVAPKLPLVLAGSLFMGAVLGALAVYIQDQLDDRFGSPEEMTSQLGVSVLSLVRTLKTTGGEGIDAIQMHNGADDVEIEAFRTLRTALAFSGETSDRLVISSAEPSDGKTTITANLATAFAHVGKRTIVIDADMRRPGMTSLLGMKGQPGLTDILVADADVHGIAEQVVRPTGIENFDVISAGPRRPNPAELLAGKNLTELLAWADGRYDQVLVDCPPVLAVSDAQIVGRLVDGVVLVVTPEKNHRHLVARACDNFKSAGIHLFGVVANRISEQTGGGYGYGYEYSYGHEASDDGRQSADEADVIEAAWDGVQGSENSSRDRFAA